MDFLPDTPFAGEGGEAVEGDAEFLRARVPFFSAEDLAAVQITRPLAEGSFGTVSIISCKGQKAVKKVLKCEEDVALLLWEARVTAELDGAGGAPRLLAVCTQPPAVLLEFAGRCYDDFVQCHCTVGVFLDSLMSIADRLSDIHSRGFLHNDVKGSNVMVRGPNPRPTFHFIDFGLATRIGQPFTFDFFGMKRYAPKQSSSFRSPETPAGLPLGPASDVFSFGVMMSDMLDYAKCPLLSRLLAPLLARCARLSPEDRPSLTELAEEVLLTKAKVPDKFQRKRLGNIRAQSVNPKKGKQRR